MYFNSLSNASSNVTKTIFEILSTRDLADWWMVFKMIVTSRNKFIKSNERTRQNTTVGSDKPFTIVDTPEFGDSEG